jgi:hypothetical protein
MILLASLTLISVLWFASHIVVMLILLQILQCTQSEVAFEGLGLWDLHLFNWKEVCCLFLQDLTRFAGLYFVGYLCRWTTLQLKFPYLNEVCSCHVLIFLYTESFFFN